MNLYSYLKSSFLTKAMELNAMEKENSTWLSYEFKLRILLQICDIINILLGQWYQAI